MITLVLGLPGSGKSSIAKNIAGARLNRDEMGGSLDDLAKEAEQMILEGKDLVLDNTYVTKESRKSIIEVAKRNNVQIVAKIMNTTSDDCQINVCLRALEKYGEIPQYGKKYNDPGMFPAAAIFKAKNTFELPTVEEGFDSVEIIEFKRVWGKEYVNKAVFLDIDDTLRTSTGKQFWAESAEDVKVLPGRTEQMNQWKRDGYMLFGVSNQSPIAKGLSETKVIEAFNETKKQLGVEFPIAYCKHAAHPLACYCRKPGPGMAIEQIFKHKLYVKKCFMVGDSTSDITMAKRLGMAGFHPDKIFTQSLSVPVEQKTKSENKLII